jgi:hypothetical protein
VPKHFKNCEYHLLYCSAGQGCGLVGTSSDLGAIGSRKQMHVCPETNGCVRCVSYIDGAAFLAHVPVGVVFNISTRMSSVPACTRVFLAMPCLMMVQPRVSNCDCFPSLIVISRTSWHTLFTR